MYRLIILFTLMFFACENGTPTDNDQIDQSEQEQPANTQTKDALTPPENLPVDRHPIIKDFQKSFSDDKITFSVISSPSNASDIHVELAGLANGDWSQDLKVEGHLANAYLLDLNQDGFSELYLAIALTDDSGDFVIKGIASYRDKSAGEIYVKDSKEIRKMKTDKVYEEGGKLMRSYENEKGETVVINYELIKGETSFILRPEKN